MERLFLGRYGADPGRYEMPSSVHGKYASSHVRKISIHKMDRGLLPLDKDKLTAKSKLYNMSHAAIGPGSYKNDEY